MDNAMNTLKIQLVALVLSLPGILWAGDNSQIAVLASFAAIDYNQSVELFYDREREGFFDSNPVLGKHPERREMMAFGIVGVGLTWAAVNALPPAWAALVADSVVSSEQAVVEDNARLLAGEKKQIAGVPIILTWRW